MPSTRKYSSSASDDLGVAPPAKKPKLRINVKPRKPSESPGDTIAVSTRPKRESAQGKSYNRAGIFINEPPEPVREVESPAPSSGLSSLSSAPPTPSEDGDKEESPFRDPTPTSANIDNYGDFSSYYIVQGSDDEEEPAAAPVPKSTGKVKATAKKSDSPKQSKKAKPKEPKPKPVKRPKTAKATTTAPAKPSPNLAQQTAPQPSIAGRPPPPQPNGPPPLPQEHHQAIPVQHQARPQNLPPNYPNPPPPRPLPNGPPPPIIQYMEIQTDPKPTRPDTIDIMIRKLEALSAALTNFGGVPAIPPTPETRPVDQPKPKAQPQAPSKPQPKPVEIKGGDAVDNFLMHFGDDDDDDSESEDQAAANMLRNPGAPDGPLTYGIQFIQNALKSWAQQRTSQQVTTQWQAQQAQLQSQIKRGPGRPKRYDETISHVQPVIHMDLGNTPEGIAIKAFQAVLDSGCMQVNCVLPIELSRALRHLYMQIDHLINQGQKVDGPWQCMSYGAQIAAHKQRIAKFKEAQQKAQDEAVQQQKLRELGIAHTVPLSAAVPLSAFQAQQQHEMELERRRNELHATQQPYNSHSHLYPMQVSAQAPGGPAPPNSAGRGSAPPGVPVGSPTTADQHHINSQGGMPGPSSLNQGGAAGRELEKIKLYLPPGYLPRSGQSMKFSFAPSNETVAQAWGSEAFPPDHQGPNIPNRGPMSAPPSQPALADNRPGSAANVPGGDAGSPIDVDADATMQDAPSAQAPATNGQPTATSSTPAPVTTGFTSVNAPPAAPAEQRPDSVPAGSPAATSPGTIKVATKPPSTSSASASPNIGFQAVNRPNGAAMSSNYPHPGAIVVDQ